MDTLGLGNTYVNYFSVDFLESEIFLSGKAYPLGYFSVDILNWSNELITELLFLGAPVFNASADIIEHGLSREPFERAKTSLLKMQEIILSRKPFSLLDLDREHFRTTEYFSEESYTRMLTNPKALEEFQNFLKFYVYIPSDVANFKLAIINLEQEKLSVLKNRNEDSFARSCQQFFTDPMVILALEAHKPAPHFQGFNPQPIVKSMMVVSEHPTEKKSLTFVHRMYFSCLMDFLVTEFFRGLHTGHSPKQCPVCRRYFLMTSGAHQIYCDGLMPDDPKHRTCRQAAASNSRAQRERAPSHPIKSLCTTRLGTINKHLHDGVITEDFAKASKKLAQDCRDKALQNNTYANGAYQADMTQEAIYARVKSVQENS